VSRFLTALLHVIGYSVPHKLLSRINFTYDMSGNVIKYNYVRSRLLSYDKKGFKLQRTIKIGFFYEVDYETTINIFE